MPLLLHMRALLHSSYPVGSDRSLLSRRGGNRVSAILASITVVFTLVAVPPVNTRAASSDIVERFNGQSLNKAVWATQRGGVGPTLGLADGHLELALPATSRAAARSTEFFAGIRSRCSFTGDFDVRVSYVLMNWAVYNGARLGLLVEPAKYSRKGGVHLERASWSVRDSTPAGSAKEVYASNFYDGVSYVSTMDTTGRLRIVRRGNRVTGYTYQSGGWELMHAGTGPSGAVRVGVRLWAHEHSFERQYIRVAFDNLRITRGQPTCARSALPK